MRKLSLPFLLASLLLTSCNINSLLIKEDVSPSSSKSEVVLNNEVNEEPVVSKEEPKVVIPEASIIEEPVVESSKEPEPVVSSEIEEEVTEVEETIETPVLEQPETISEEVVEPATEIVEEPTEVQAEEEPEVELSPNITVFEEPGPGEEPIRYDTLPTTLRSPVYRPSGTTSIETLNLDVRSYEATITDSGRVNQKMDTVYLDYNYGGLEDLGYYWLEVKVTLTAKEVHDGYQYLFLYNTSKCQSSAESLLENFIPCVGDDIKEGMLCKEQFEIGAGYKKTSWETRTFRFYVYVGNMVENLYLRYGASGILSDTWINKDIKVSVTPKMTKN